MTIITHGCRSNLAERDALAALAGEGVTVINSCAVTATAVGDARAAAVRALRSGPVALTGCAVEVAADRFSDLDVRIVPNALKLNASYWGASHSPFPATVQSRGFIAVQDGCDHDCTFCVTRIARGPSRSLPMPDIMAEARRMVEMGVAEIVLTGIDTGSWLGPGGERLGTLVQKLLSGVPALRRLRLSSLDVADADPALVEAFADPRMMPHLHLSLQSGDDLVLKRMKRRHSRAMAIGFIQNIKGVRGDIAIGADLIAGFPTESAEAHKRSLALLDDCDIVHAHIFPYSPRPGTPGARMPQQEQGVGRARAAELRHRADDRKREFLAARVGRRMETVSEGKRGLAPDFAVVRYAEMRPRGQIVEVRARAVEDGMLVE